MDNAINRLTELNHQYVWHPFTQMKDWISEIPLFIERGEGNWLIDTDGKRYLDGVSSLWANIHGHVRPEINQAIVDQLHKISHTTMLGLTNVPATELAKMLVQIAPGRLNKVFYSDNGATSVEIALKMAYQYWQQKDHPIPSKKSFIKLKESYHGDTIGSVSLGGIELFHKVYSPLLFDTYDIPTPFYYHSKYNTEKECSEYSLKILRSTLEKNHDNIAGLFIEPYIQGAAGMIVFPDGYMKGVQALCKEFNILFIVDEVATGFGRTGRMFACDEDHLEPDIMTVAKGITGGYLPLAATLTTDEIYNAFLGEYLDYKTFFHGHTYTGNPLACASAIASLKLFEKDKTIESLKEKIIYLSNCLKPLLEQDYIGDIRQKGMMVGIEIVSDKKSKNSFPAEIRIGHRICMEARNHEVIIRPLGDVIVLMPPLSITIDEIKHLITAVRYSIEQITRRYGQ